MEVEAFLADSVVAAEGKLYVQGAGWNIVNAPALPYRLARAGIGLIVRIPYTATNQPHKFEIFMRDADGIEMPLAEAPPDVETPDGKIRRLGGEFNVGRPPTLEAGDELLFVATSAVEVIEPFQRIRKAPLAHLCLHQFQVLADKAEVEHALNLLSPQDDRRASRAAGRFG